MADKKIELDELLGRLTDTGDVGRQIGLFRGVAVSRSETALHLAMDGGIVEIPLAEIDEVAELAGHPNAVTVTVRDSSTVRAVRIESGDDEGASNIVTEMLAAGAGGGTIPSGPFQLGTKSTHCFKVRNNDWNEVVVDDGPNRTRVLL